MTPREIVAAFGGIFSFLLFGSPAPDYYTIWSNGNVGDNSVNTAMAMLLNCSIWLMYSLPFVHGNKTVLGINCVGAVAQMVFIAIHIYYSHEAQPPAPAQEQRKTWAKLAGVVTVVLALLVVFGGWRTQKNRAALFGVLGAISATLMYLCPAVEVGRSLVSHGNTGNMSLFVTGASFINAVIWLVYALMVQPIDTYICIPNALGALAAGLQLLAYVTVQVEANAANP